MSGAFDVAVIGGGPAGASCARALARFGFRVALFDAGREERQHVGESLPSSIRVVLEALGLDPPSSIISHRPPEHRVFWGELEGGGSNPVPAETSALVWRGPFDRYLRAEAAASGVQIFEAHPVGGVRDTDGGYELSAGPARAGCRFLVDASGRSGVLARRYRKRMPGFRTLALTGHFETFERSPPTVVEAFARGWVWSAPLRNGLRDVTVMLDGNDARGDRAGLFHAALEEATKARSLVGSSPRRGPVRGIDASPYEADRFGGEGFLLVGDAATFLDPLSAHGVHKAMDGALVAAVVIRTILDRPERMEDALAFYEDRERDIYRLTSGRLTRLYRAEHRFEEQAFWRKRSVEPDAPSPARPSPPRPPLRKDMGLRPAKGVAIVEAPVLENDYIERREALVAPGHRRPIRFLGPVCLPDLYRKVAEFSSVAAAAGASSLGFERAFGAIEWLYRFGYLEQAREFPIVEV